jgi:hypothetical protein
MLDTRGHGLKRGLVSVTRQFIMPYEGNVNMALNKLVREVEDLYTRIASTRRWQRARVTGLGSLIKYSIALCRLGLV